MLTGCWHNIIYLQKLQNRAFRIITRENYETRTADVLNKVGLPDLKSRREYQLAVLLFKIKHKTLPTTYHVYYWLLYSENGEQK